VACNAAVAPNIDIWRTLCSQFHQHFVTSFFANFISTEQIQTQTIVRWDIMMLISKIEMSVINKMADGFVDNFITGEPWYLAK